MLIVFPVAPFTAAYNGTMTALNEAVEVYFEAGESPVMEFGTSGVGGNIILHSQNKFVVSGYLVDVAP